MKNPLKYFDQILSDPQALSARIKKLVQQKQAQYEDVKELDFQKGTFKYWSVFYDPIKDDEIEAYGFFRFTDYFFPELTEETEIAISKIQDNIYSLSAKNQSPKYIHILILTLLKYREVAIENYPQFPLIASRINHLILQIKNSAGIYFPEEEFSFPSFIIAPTTSYTTELSSTEVNDIFNIVENVLGYLKLHNNKRVKILSDTDYSYMLQIIHQFIEHNHLPAIDRKITVGNISKPLLLFTFWVLHKHLYTTRPIKEDFLQMVFQLFQDFESWEFQTLKQKFGSRDKVTYKGVHFIPEIIKRELVKD